MGLGISMATNSTVILLQLLFSSKHYKCLHNLPTLNDVILGMHIIILCHWEPSKLENTLKMCFRSC